MSFPRITVLLMVLSFLSGCSLFSRKEKPKEEPVVVKKEVVKKLPPKVVKEHELWGYEGLIGPAMWGDLDPKFKLCKEGKEQSPIDLIWKRPPQKGNTLQFSYKESPFMIVDNGHTVKLSVGPGSTVKIQGEVYELWQLHFHAPSEHTISGKSYPMEVHLVHKSAQGELAVVALMVAEGMSNMTLEKIWNYMPREKHKRTMVESVKINPIGLFPKPKTHYSYKGSLTTPPCTEGVRWVVFNTPVEFSRGQVDAFEALYKNNNREVQPLNTRAVTNY
jgi:carbonic anhydrase